MKSDKVIRLLFFLFGSLISFTVLNFIYDNRLDDLSEIASESTTFDREFEYVKRNLEINKSMSDTLLSFKRKEKEFIAYYSGGACFSCLERLLTLTRINYDIDSELLIVVDSPKKLYNVEGYNDTFDQRYDYTVDSTYFIDSNNEIALIIFDNNSRPFALEFKPEEEDLFIKYFDQYF